MVFLAAIVGLIIGFALAWVIAQSRHKPVYARSYETGATEVKREMNAQLESERAKAYREGRQEGRKEALANLHVQVTPFYRKHNGGLNPLKKAVYDYGYRYQVFRDGKSCFDTSEVVLGTVPEKDFRPEDMERRIRRDLEPRLGADSDWVKFYPLLHDEPAEMGVTR
jgi:hypothetical protein